MDLLSLADPPRARLRCRDLPGAVAAAFEVVRHGGALTATRLEVGAPWRLLVMGQPEISVPADTDQCSIEV